jgi:hypothetical protein
MALTVDEIVRVQNFLFTLIRNGVPVGTLLVFAAAPANSSRSAKRNRRTLLQRPGCPVPPTAVIDLKSQYAKWSDYFDFDKESGRQIYEPVLMSLILHHSSTTRVYLAMPEGSSDNPEAMCGRCASDRHAKRFKTCRVVVVGGERLFDGCCTNCYAASAAKFCSMSGKFLSVLQTGPSLSSELY